MRATQLRVRGTDGHNPLGSASSNLRQLRSLSDGTNLRNRWPDRHPLVAGAIGAGDHGGGGSAAGRAVRKLGLTAYICIVLGSERYRATGLTSSEHRIQLKSQPHGYPTR